jgi:tetratricopeptide (TPR) repeat protein
MRVTPFLLGVVATLTTATTASRAQESLTMPEASPAARVQQTVGLTEIAVSYHRPGVGGREIWGKLVPYGEVWRAGANENTTVSFSTDARVGGKPLRAGTYGLHIIPTAKDWTVIFSTATTSWGSYSYDPKEDALRLTVTPRALPAFEERLAYRFDDPTATKVTLTLAWEKLAIQIPIEVDTPKVVMASMRSQLRGPAQFSGQPWMQAAAYWVHNNGPLDEALRMVDRSIKLGATYGNLMTRAEILEKQGKAKEAKEARDKAQPLATERDLNLVGYRLIHDKKLDQAIAVFRDVVQRYPQSWNAQDSLGEALALKGDKAGAIAAYEKALALATDAEQKKRITQVLAQLNAPNAPPKK